MLRKSREMSENSRMLHGFVTTHVLDTALGRPAAGLGIEVYRLDGNHRVHLGSFVTNEDGRTDAPVIAGDDLAEAEYEFEFLTGPYLDAAHGPVQRMRFLQTVIIRFGVGDTGQHYHVPLLLSPHGYSTYRGS
jgi:5-hydroxyisourate hydrolase